MKLFTAGPVNVSDKVKRSVVYSEIGHREPEFTELLYNVRKKLLAVFGGNSDYSTVIINGSGTAAIESVLMSCVHESRKILIVSNGQFGERMAEICKLHQLGLRHLSFEWGNSIDLERVESAVKEDRSIEAVAMVLLETSTGMINPVHKVGQLCKKYGRFFVVDAVSGLGGEPLNVVYDNIDFCISNTNKCLSGLPVLSFVCVKREAMEQIRDIKPRGFYLDLLKHFSYEDNLNQTPFTPQIPLLYMLNAALDELLLEGVENRIKRYHDNSHLLREKLETMELKFQIEKSTMSNVLTNVFLPEGTEYQTVHDKLKQKGYIIYPGKGVFANRIMHIANVGTLTQEEVLAFCSILEEVLGY